jgi:hypothetical protein
VRAILILFFFIFRPATLLAPENWAYELSPQAKEIYLKKVIQIPCEKISELLREKNDQDLYLAIRDAGIFKQESCRPIIQKHMDQLTQLGLKGVPLSTCSGSETSSR